MLTSLGEAFCGDRRPSEADHLQARRHLQEALELFQRCLSLQEFKYNQALEDAAQASRSLTADDINDPKQNHPDGAVCDKSSEEEVWVYVEEPISRTTLLETTLAQLETLTALCPLRTSPGHDGLAWIEEYYRTTLRDKIKAYAGNNNDIYEVAHTEAMFISALSDAAFQNGHLDAISYERELIAAFSAPGFNPIEDSQGLCDRADAEMTFATSIHAASGKIGFPAGLHETANMCWKHISKALELLTAASKLSDTLHISRIHVRRGDCEMLRLRLGYAPLNYELAAKSMPTLLKNAEIYYNAAITPLIKGKDHEEEQSHAKVKAAVAAALSGDIGKLSELFRYQRSAVEATVEDMKDEDLLGEVNLRMLEQSLMQSARSEEVVGYV